MTPEQLRDYLYTHIPLSRAMAVDVIVAGVEGVTLSAPLAPNINHRATVFGGSANALAILAAWSLLYLRVQAENLDARLVIQNNSMVYERPIAGAFTARCDAPPSAGWTTFVASFARKGRARIVLDALVLCEGARAGAFTGDFVALRTDTATRVHI